MMKIVTARNLAFCSPDGTGICADVTFSAEKDSQWFPFVMMNNDITEHGQDAYNRALSGEFGNISDYAPPENPLDEDMIPTEEL